MCIYINKLFSYLFVELTDEYFTHKTPWSIDVYPS